MDTLIELVKKEMAKPTKTNAKTCRACRKWGGCPPGRPRGAQPKGWLLKTAPPQGPKIAARHPKMILNPG